MTLPAPTYDLVLLLDTQAEDSARAKILADARSSIEARGELLRHDDWGERPLAYPIDRRKSADYHLFQFHASDTDLLNGLDRTLRITDGVVRFRLIKLRPGVPDPPDMRSSAPPTRRAEGEPAPRTAPGTEGEAPAPSAAEAAEAPAPEQDLAPAAPADAPAGESPTPDPAAAESAPAESAGASEPAAQTGGESEPESAAEAAGEQGGHPSGEPAATDG